MSETIIVVVDGVPIDDVTTYRDKLTATRKRLADIYRGFDPANPDALLAREAEIVDLANAAERLREIVERWDEAEKKRANILAAWELVKAFTGDQA